MTKDWHSILGITKEATAEQIKIAYRQKAMEFHPDRYKGSDASKRFMEVNDAYRALTDPNFKVFTPPPKPRPRPSYDAPPPTKDIWGNPIRNDGFKDSMNGNYHVPKPRPRPQFIHRPIEKEVDLWAQTKSNDPWTGYWKEYERLKKIMVYDEPDAFWDKMDEWMQKNGHKN